MLKVERAIAFTLPDGSYIKVETTGTGREGAEAGPDDWSALDVTLVRKDESESLLCSVEYDDPKGMQRVVFIKAKDPVLGTNEYRFLGIFKKSGTHCIDGKMFNRFVRTAASFPILRE